MIEKTSGLPMKLNEVTGELMFEDGLLCDGNSQKQAFQMNGLFHCPVEAPDQRLVYRAYRNIRYQKDEELFKEHDYRYDITVVLPGQIEGEFFKTSGHFHGYQDLTKNPYPEVYEVLEGEIIFVLQRNPTFDQPDGGEITQLQAVRVKAGQAIIVPSHCGHGSINPTNGVSAFSNLAVVSCPIDYEPVKAHQGLAAYIMQGQGSEFTAVKNPHYDHLPEIELAQPVENSALGIEFGVSCYHNFIAHPERYDFLGHPDTYLEQIDAMTKPI